MDGAMLGTACATVSRPVKLCATNCAVYSWPGCTSSVRPTGRKSQPPALATLARNSIVTVRLASGCSKAATRCSSFD